MNALIIELQEDQKNSRQVNKILRDKLTDAMGELVEAREQVSDLERKQLQEPDTLKQTSHQLGEISNQVSALFDTVIVLVNVHERKRIDALAEAQRVEENFQDAQLRNDALQSKLSESQSALDVMIQKNKADLKSLQERLQAECAERLASQELSHNQRLHALERKHAGELTSHKLTATIPELQRQQEAFVGASVDFKRKLSNQENLQRKSADAHEPRADIAEKRVASLERQAQSTNLRTASVMEQKEAADGKAEGAERSAAKATKTSASLGNQVSELTAALHSAREQVVAMQAPSKDDELRRAHQKLSAVSKLPRRLRKAPAPDDEAQDVDNVGSMINLEDWVHPISDPSSAVAKDSEAPVCLTFLRACVLIFMIHKGQTLMLFDDASSSIASTALTEAVASDCLMDATMVAVFDGPREGPSLKPQGSPPEDFFDEIPNEETPVKVLPRPNPTLAIPRRSFKKLSEDASEAEDDKHTKQGVKRRRTVASDDPIVDDNPVTLVPKPKQQIHSRRSGVNRKSVPPAVTTTRVGRESRPPQRYDPMP
ncbi:hypothetical protein HGRIS_001056 [Hohenbuehelia grisea]